MTKIDKIEDLLKNINIDKLEIEKDEKIKQIEKLLTQKEKISDQDIQFLKEYEKKLKSIYPTLTEQDIKKTNLYIYQVLKQSEKEKQPEEETSQENVEFKYKVTITADEQQCFLTLQNISNYTISYDDIINILNKHNVTMGIQEDKIKSIVERCNKGETIKDELVAEGKMPEVGEPAYFIFKFKNDESLVRKYLKEKLKSMEEISETREGEEKKEPKDDKDIESLIEEELKNKKILCGVVKKREILAKKVPPTKGKDGFTVTGKIIPGRLGEDAQLRIKRNVKFDKDNNLYIAEADGEAILDENLLWVRRYTPGSFHIRISNDEMAVYLTIIPSIGGAEPASIEAIKAELQRNNIQVKIDEDLIKKSIKEAEEKHRAVYNIKIAEGKKPINGDDGRIEYKIRIASGRKFKVLEDGRIDFKEQDLVTLVKKDSLIAVLYKPTSGKQNGMTVTGKLLPAEPGKPFSMEAGKNVRAVDYPDKTEFYSEINGHLKIEYTTLTVLPVYIVENDVDFSTGNINFHGDVIIRGDIKDEFKVFAEGDIIVNGNIGASEITGMRDVIAKNGVLGKNKGKIVCNRNFYGRFVENGYIEAEKDVTVEKAIINSRIFANGSVNVVRDRGQIIGGEIWAGKKISAKLIGTSTGAKTELTVGYNFKIRTELENIRKKREEYTKTLVRLDEIIKQLFKEQSTTKNFTDDVKKIYAESVRKKALIVGYLHKLKQRESELSKNLIIDESPEIIAYETIFSDVKINYLNRIFIIQDSHYKVKIKKEPEKNKVTIIELS